MRFTNRWVCCCAMVFALAMSASPGFAQFTGGRIDGTVMDQTGAVVPGASVILKGETIADQETKTGGEGDFHFLNLQPGRYTVIVKMPSFADIQRTNVVVATGVSTALEFQLKPAAQAETVNVTAESPTIDPRTVGNVNVFDQTLLQKIPSARDPWDILKMTPGVLVDRLNVGGNESGQQSVFMKGASDQADTMWMMDGITITDPSAIGASPTYYDFDAFEEMQFSTGGNDPKLQTGGIGINFVTKRGTNAWRGSGRFNFDNDAMQADNRSDFLKNLPRSSTFPIGFAGNKIDRVYEVGAEIGGPIQRDKLWFWGSAARNDIKNIIITGFPDDTQLVDTATKFNWQANPSNQLTFFWYRGDKKKQGRNAGVTRPPETTWNQSGPSNIYKFEDNITLGTNTFVQARYAFIDGGFQLDPQGGRNTNVSIDGATGVWHGSFLFLDTSRAQHQFQIDGNRFAGTHELKFGFQYRTTTTESLSAWPGNKAIADRDDGLAFLMRDAHHREKTNVMSLYVGDTISMDRLTANLNVRFDHQTGRSLAAHIDANPLFPDLLPAVDVPDSDAVFSWNDISPRLGLTYALGESRKTLLRANYGRYASQIYTTLIAWDKPGGYSSAELDYVWNDRNNNNVVERNEVDFGGLAGYYYVNPSNPRVSPNRVNPDLKAPITQEFIFGLDHELRPAFSVGFNFNMGRTSNTLWTPLIGATSANFVPNATPVTGTLDVCTPIGESACPVTYSQQWFRLARGVVLPDGLGTTMDNRPDYRTQYWGIQLTANKRLSNRWMMKGHFTINRPRITYDNIATAFQNPTSTQISGPGLGGPSQQDAPFYVASGAGSGSKSDVFINSEWQFNISGLYEGPMGINFAANLFGRQGYPTVYYHRVANPDFYTTFIRVLPFETDRFRNPNLYLLDGRVEKDFAFDQRHVILSLEVFNMLNRGTTTQTFSRINTSTAGQIREILSPMIARFQVGVRF